MIRPYSNPAIFAHAFTGRTSGTPSPYCRGDKLDGFSATARCSESGTHARDRKKVGVSVGCRVSVRKSKLTLQIPQATVHSSVVDEPWLAWHSIPSNHQTLDFGLHEGKTGPRRTEIHDVITADCAVVDDNIPRPQSDRVPLEEQPD